MKRKLLLIVLFFAFLANTGFAATRDAVVKIVCRDSKGVSSGSGVCVSEDGIILTIAHIVRDGTCEVLFGNKSYSVVKSFIPSKEGVAVLKVETNYPLPFLGIADTQPPVGTTVWAMGYPEGNWKTFGTTVTDVNAHFARDPSTRLIGVFHFINFGTSGGPLVTKEWKVCGIASVTGKIPSHLQNRGRRNRNPRDYMFVDRNSSSTGGMYVSLSNIKAAYVEFTSQKVTNKRPTLYYLTGSNCRYCRNFERDVKAKRFSAYDVKPIYSEREWIRIAGRWNQEGVPRFYIKGSGKRPIVGYDGAPGLLQILGGIVKGLANLFFNPEAEPKTQSTSPFIESNPSLSEPPLVDPSPVPKELENPELKKIRSDIVEAKSDIADAFKDLKTLKSGSAFEKIPAMIRLKGEIDAVKEDAATIKEDGIKVSKSMLLKINDAKAELDTIRDVAKQDISGIKAAVAVLKDEDASKLQKAIAVAPALKKAVSDAKYLKNWLGDPKSDINGLLLFVGSILGAIKGYKGVKG